MIFSIFCQTDSNKLCKFFVCFQTWHPKLDAIEYKFMEIFAHQFGCLANGLAPASPSRGTNANHRYQKTQKTPSIWGRGSVAGKHLWLHWTCFASCYKYLTKFTFHIPKPNQFLRNVATGTGEWVNIRSDKLELHLSQEKAGGKDASTTKCCVKFANAINKLVSCCLLWLLERNQGWGSERQ